MRHRRPPEHRRGPLGWWLVSAVCAVAGLALVLGSCSTTAAPPEPPASAAGSLAESAPTTSSATSTAAASSAPSTTTASIPGTSPRPSTTTRTTARSATSAPSAAPPTRPTVTLPSFTHQVTGPVLPASPPVSLTIPAIGVQDSPVMSLGLAADGTVQVPPLEDTRSSGWYRGSPTPGQLGPAIMLGHVDSARSGPSVFYKLGDLRPGDEVDVTRQDGTVAVFRVDGVREYPKTAFPTQTVYGNIDHAGLRLITCGGAFNPSVGHYESNIIAFATLVSSRRA